MWCLTKMARKPCLCTVWQKQPEINICLPVYQKVYYPM